MKFKTRFYEITLYQSYGPVLLTYLRELNSKAGAAWIDTAVNKTPIPTWSGASRSTFVKLALELGTSVSIGPIRSKKSRVGLGAASAANSRVVENKRKAYFGFMYETSLRYLEYNEYHAAVAGPPPQPYTNNVRFTPYLFQGRAQAAWQAVADKAKLPNPYKYLRKRKMK